MTTITGKGSSVARIPIEIEDDRDRERNKVRDRQYPQYTRRTSSLHFGNQNPVTTWRVPNIPESPPLTPPNHLVEYDTLRLYPDDVDDENEVRMRENKKKKKVTEVAGRIVIVLVVASISSSNMPEQLQLSRIIFASSPCLRDETGSISRSCCFCLSRFSTGGRLERDGNNLLETMSRRRK